MASDLVYESFVIWGRERRPWEMETRCDNDNGGWWGQ